MAVFEGDLVLQERPWTRNRVLAQFRISRLIMTDPSGRWLGAWSVFKVSAQQIDDSRLEMALGDKNVIFKLEDPARFHQTLQAEKRIRMGKRVVRRILGALLLPALRLTGIREGDAANETRAVPPVADRVDVEREPISSRTDTTDEPSPENGTKKVDWRLLEAQRNAVNELRSAMAHWFGFFFLLGEGTDQERLQSAAFGLQTTARNLKYIADNLDDSARPASGNNSPATTYRTAVKGWADALDLIARGAVLDQQQVADEGFQRLARASADAEQVVDTHANTVDLSLLTESLSYLSDLQPARKIPQSRIDSAKHPWRRAIIAAGSPFKTSESS